MKRVLYFIIISMLLFVNVNASTHNTRVLLIEIDPVLTKGNILNNNCTNKKASVCLGQDSTSALNEIMEDIKYSSHDSADTIIVKKEYLNEFPSYTTSDRLNEDTWLDIMRSGWYSGINDSRVVSIGSYKFDYEYIIDKYNLIERKNNNEFDEVWILNVDPSSMYESIMVGKSAYWLNADPIIKDCDNFKIMNISISRRDVNLESFGHAAEIILNEVFTSRYNSYQKNSLTNFNIDELNLWERFTLNNYASPGYSSAGNIHFAPNSEKDYDWQNSKYTSSSYTDWEEYPNITGENIKVNSDIWVPYTNSLFSAARMHHRWWFRLMPHINGRTSNGYSNNWWEYLTSNDYVTEITGKKTYTYYVGDKISLPIVLKYKSKKEKNVEISSLENNIYIGKNISSKNGLVAESSGSSVIKYYYDGKSIEIRINIYDKNEKASKIPTEDNEEKKDIMDFMPIIMLVIVVIVGIILLKSKNNKNNLE